MINWKIRLKNKNFWLAIVPAVLLLVQAIASVFGYTVDFSDLQGKLIAVVNAIFYKLRQNSEDPCDNPITRRK